MLARLFLVLTLVTAGVVLVSGVDDCCSAEDRREVATIWHQVWSTSYTSRKVKIMRAVWDDLVHSHPEIRDFMVKAGITSEDTPEFRAHVIRIAHGLDNLINLLDNPMILEEQIHHMATRYGAKVGLKKTYFDAISESFQNVIPKIASCFNKGAWGRCLNRLASAVSSQVEAH